MTAAAHHMLAVDMLAHQGGWDEILMVAGPLLVFAGVLYLANKRANDKLAEQAVETTDDVEAITPS